MSKQILIELKATDNASQPINKASTAVTNLGKKADAAMKETKAGVTDVMGQLDALGNRFRYMSIVVGALSVGTMAMMKSFVDAAREGEQSFLKLGVYAASAGENMSDVNQVAQELANTGLISVTEAATGLSNFLATGLGLEKAKNLMWNFLNSASVAKESLTDTLGTALEKTSVGFRVFMERNIDATGINTQLNKVFQEYAKSIDTVSTKLTNAQKYQAMYNFYMKEGERFTGAATLVQNTFSGALSKLDAQIYQMKIALGNTLIPLVGTLADMFSWVSSKISEFAKNSSAATSVILVGVTALSVLAATLAMVGAMLPLLVSGFVVLNWTALAPMIVAGAQVAAVFLAISVAIGGLVYLVLKATGQWDKWKNSISALGDKIKSIISELVDAGDKIAELDAKTIKQLKKIQDSMNMTTRDYVEGMREWVDAHDKTVKDLTRQIDNLQKDYSTAIKKIKDDFSSAMDDLNLNHARKTEDIQQDLNEEVSKGIWADQTKIRELEKSLKRENEDYAISSAEKLATKEEGLTKEKTQLDEKLLKLQEELDAEKKLESDHADFIAKARTWPILDEIDKRTRAFNERIQQYQEERQELLDSASSESDALDEVINKYSSLNTEIENTGKTALTTSESIMASVETMKKQVNENGTAIEQTGTRVRNAFLTAFGTLAAGTANAFGNLPNSVGGAADIMIPDFVKSFFSNIFNQFSAGAFEEGGIVPGSIGQAVPILAHGGEAVLPAGVSPININIMNPTVRSDDDIKKIADAVRDVLSREQALKKFK